MDLLPVRVAPLAGEAIYLWLEATARADETLNEADVEAARMH